jgi:hypothetical protein
VGCGGGGRGGFCTQPPWLEVRSLNLARVRTGMGRCPCVREDCLCKRHARRGERCQARTATSGLCAACRDNVPASSNGWGTVAYARALSQPATASADPSAVFEPPPVVDRPRVTRKSTPPEVPLVIHHIKLAPRSGFALGKSIRLEELGVAAVRSHGAPQVIWSYDSVEMPPAHPNVVRICDARMLLPEGQFKFLVRKGIPLPHIKDPRSPQCSLSAPALPRRAAAERLDTPSSNPSRCALRSFVLGQAMVSLDPCCPASNGARPHPTAFPHLYVSGHPLYAVLGFVRRRVY